ncbi:MULTISPECIES: MFS transporter [Cytobacillus]|uniref:MFS transporter n=1 Tax=Cytobacillus TaxID=2675230 RepID=UPI00203C39D9|nr:MFS transporter [Cytobacillus firmus]MCM3708448.1 MFS transporter [Cytobacillus firmus]
MKFHKFFEEHLITVITFLIMIGIMGTRPLISLLSYDLKASPIEIGFIIALFPLLPTFLAIKIGYYVDLMGYKKPIICSTIMCACSLSIPMLFVSLEAVYISQLAAGIGQTIFVVSAQAMAGQLSMEESQREKNIMKFSIGVALGSFIGPLAGGMIGEKYGYPFAIGALGSIGFLSVFLTFFLKGKSRTLDNTFKQKNRILDSVKLLKGSNLRRAFLVSILVLLGKDIYTAYFPLLAIEFKLTVTAIGIIVSINAIAGILIRWSLPSLLNMYSRTFIAMGSIILSGMCFLLLPFFNNIIVLSMFSFILGIGLGLGQPLSISSTINCLPNNKVGEGLGLRLTVNRLTQMSAPVLFGAIANFISMSAVFWIVGGLLLLGGRKTSLEEGKKESF